MSGSGHTVQILTAKQHVPAWKRIGLKLKYANDTPKEAGERVEQTLATPPLVASEAKANKRERVDEAGSEHAPKVAKKRKTMASKEDRPQMVDEALVSQESSHQDANDSIRTDESNAAASVPAQSLKKFKTTVQGDTITDPAQSAKPTARSRRKSVAFTSDTKGDDGISTQRLSKEGNSTSQPGDANSSGENPSELAAKPSKKDKKQSKRQQDALAGKEDQNPKDAADPKALPEYVRYLEQYHTDKASWKFNKSKQNSLLKNIFNVHRVLPKHHDALIAYIAGLQGAAAKQRLAEEAEAVLKELLEKQGESEAIVGLGSRTARKAAYDAALQREIEKVEGAGRSEYDEQQLHELRWDVERAKRADAVFAELLNSTLDNADNTNADASLTSNVGAASGDAFLNGSISTAPKRKKRKARTEVSSDESSSDSSSSESSISSSSESSASSSSESDSD